MTWTLLHRRPDGSFVISLNGLPYHVTEGDPLYPAVSAAAEGVDLPPEPEPPSPPALEPAMIAKTAIYRRATDQEIETFEAWLLNDATPRQRLMWHDAEGGLVLLSDVQPIAEALFGAERAAELLAI